MQTETVDVRPEPMIYVRHRSSMDPNEIGRVMGEAFETLGAFIGQHQIPVAGPALSIYHDYAEDGSMTIDIGFPVPAAVLGKATGDVKAGETPSGNAIKVVHKGPYDTLHETYDKLREHFAAESIAMQPIAWEVYIDDPVTTPDADLRTEIYMKAA